MHFPKHWQLARREGIAAWGWSDVSAEAAAAEGQSRLERIRAALRSGRAGTRERYGYPDRPMREEVLREFTQADGSRSAVVSRNSYGSLVLNTANAMFVDVDEPPTSLTGAISRWFRKSPPFESTVVARVEEWTRTHSNAGWRVYRTRAGIRLLATDEPISPQAPLCDIAFEHFATDPLYRRLCHNQKCFRARLTPKPWRCGVGQPPHRWPWPDAAAETRFHQWNERYAQAAAAHSTCRLLGQFGRPEIHEQLAELVAFHDEATRAATDMPLA